MEVTRALTLGRRLLREHGLDDWTIVADRAKTRAGVCRFGRRQIGISAPITTLHDESEVLDTILHEIAHALVGPEHGHDGVWRAKALEIGCSGERCVSTDSPRVPGDWVGRCPAGHEKSRHRAPTRLMSCGQCSRRFDARYLFTWSYRGRPASLPPSYAAQLAALRVIERPTQGAVLEVGQEVEVVAPGPWRGLVGEVELVGAVRCQVRVDDELVSLPLDAVRRAAPSAARRQPA
ncbi:SprT-like domain-containing protein [Oryzobacter sp. R7]|uniref:SprT-like domain-containing protein n=1 Tax=Oryzobacter faecalis TaxID=3388656 RepID=UPI00398D2403